MNRRSFVRHSAVAAATLIGPRRAFGAPPAQFNPPLRVNGARLNNWLTQFDRVGRTAGGINRVGYSDADIAGRAFTLDLYRAAGLTPRIDAAGNIVARLDGTAPDRSQTPIIIGSHVDSVTDGGNFDGPLGSFAAIEVARTLREQRIQLRHPLEVVVWANEEGGLVGSKLAVGDGASFSLDSPSRSGFTIREGIARIGGDVSRLEESIRPRGSAACYLELHIEQGGLLDAAGLQVGVVEGIVGLQWLEITIDGFSNHAGTTPMDQRQDALLAAAKFTVAVNDAVRAMPGRHVATIGSLMAEPNTRNVIAGRVKLSIDTRDLNAETITRLVATFERLAREVGEATGTRFSVERMQRSSPALADARVMSVIGASAGALGLSSQQMPSGAGHDAQMLASIAPMGMIFVPSVGGISHSPREFTRAEDCANGADVLLNAVVALDLSLSLDSGTR
jgi:beta-ureidopropionase / N-carbamoyl-L-amino-acid hydrolase